MLRTRLANTTQQTESAAKQSAPRLTFQAYHKHQIVSPKGEAEDVLNTLRKQASHAAQRCTTEPT